MAVRLTGAPVIVRRQKIRQRMLVLFRLPFVPGPFATLVRLARGPGYIPPYALLGDHTLIEQIRWLRTHPAQLVTVTVPNVIGLLESAALTLLQGLGLTTTETYVISPAQPPDTVLTQSIAAGTMVVRGTNIALSIVAYLVTPNVVGLQQAAALTALVGFTVTVSTMTNAAPSGQVISQSVPPGTVVAQGTPADLPEISIVVSTGPGFPGFTLGQALAILSNAGFVVNPVFIYQYSNTVPWNYVIGQLPAAGTQQKYQSVGVQLTVSLGPKNPVQTAVVPSVTGLQLTTAVSDFMAARINVGTVTWQLGPQPICSVLSQSVAGGTIVAPYTSVNLTVCSGPTQTILIDTTQTVPLVH